MVLSVEANLADRVNSSLGETVLGDLSDSPEQPHREGIQEGSLVGRLDDDQTSGLATCDATLAKCLVRATPIRQRQTDLVPHALSGYGPHAVRRPKQVNGSSHIEETLVDRNPLDQRSEVVEDRDDRITQTSDSGESARHELDRGAELRALRPGIPARTP